MIAPLSLRRQIPRSHLLDVVTHISVGTGIVAGAGLAAYFTHKYYGHTNYGTVLTAAAAIVGSGVGSLIGFARTWPIERWRKESIISRQIQQEQYAVAQGAPSLRLKYKDTNLDVIVAEDSDVYVDSDKKPISHVRLWRRPSSVGAEIHWNSIDGVVEKPLLLEFYPRIITRETISLFEQYINGTLRQIETAA